MNRLRRLIVVLLILFLVPVRVSCAAGSSYIPCDCPAISCSCFIQADDEGMAVEKIIDLLIEKKYLPKGTPHNIYSENVRTAVEKFQDDNSLDVTGMMDDDTLTLLLWGVLPEKLDKQNHLIKMVYIPVHGGKKRHSNEFCSKMDNPRKVSERNAEKLGFDPCKKCFGK